MHIGFVRRTTLGTVALLEVDNPPVNVLSAGVPEDIVRAVKDAELDSSIEAIVLRGAGRTFIVGADLTLLQRAAHGELDAAADLHDLLSRMEDCSKPVVMAIHGNALGGGLELAMAGHFRVAVAEAMLGQPEVNLGIVPGAEGTQRLPRLVGVETAIEMCVSGKPVKATEALAAGLVDAVVRGDLAEEAIGFARNVAAGGGPHPKTRERLGKLGIPELNAPLFAAGRQLAAKTR